MFAKFLLLAMVGAAVTAERLNSYGAPPQTNRFNGNGNGLSDNYGAPSGQRAGVNDQYSAPSNNIFSDSRGGNGRRGNGNGGYGNGNGNNGPSEEELLAQSIPGGGVPGEDFPVLSSVPDTGFSCEEQEFSGYYADDADEAGCQVFHICQLREDGQVQQDSFLCPNGTIFNQQYLVCDWWYNFDCSTAQDFYSVNEQIGVESAADEAGFGGRSGAGGYGNGNGNSASASRNVASGYSAPPSSRNGGAGQQNGYGYN